MKTFDKNKTIFLIDGSSFLYRAYYGMRPLHTATGDPVHAVYGFCRMIKKLSEKFNPSFMALVWDSKGKTERHEIFEDYKATRQSPPSDLFTQKEKILEFADLIDLHQVAQVGVEADDLLYSMAKDFEKNGYQVVLVTSDKDLFQLLEKNIFVFDAFKDQLVTREMHEEKIEFDVGRMPLYFSLLGDSSDNIPGVRGIGKKGATEIAQQFENLDDLYKNIDQVVKPRTKNALLENKEKAYLSLELFSLRYHKLDLSVKKLEFDIKNWGRARKLFAELEFKSFLKELGGQQATIFGAQPQQFFADAKGYKFLPITTEKELVVLCEELKKNLFAIDTETTGLDPLQADLVGISVCYKKGLAYYIPISHKNILEQLDKNVVMKHLQPILESTNFKKVLHNTKFDQLVFWHAGINLNGVAFDTMLAANLTTEDWQRVGLKQLSERYFGDVMLSHADVVKTKKYKDFSDVGLAEAVKYAAADAHQTFLLYDLFKNKIEEQGQGDLFYNIEMPLSQVLLAMEKKGVYLNTDKLKVLGTEVDGKIAALEKEIKSLTGIGPDFNLNSPRQIEDLLFNQLNLPPQKKSTKRTGYSTDQEVLDILSDMHPVPKLILKYRELYKLKTTYIDALPEYVNKDDGRVHTTFSQIRTATGRLASSEPNLQNVPVVGIGGGVRAAFEPQGDNLFLSADYSQIELRVLAHLSQDKTLLAAFQNGEDIHTRTASRLFETEPSSVNHDMRQIGKRINFSILYGLTPYGLSKDLKIPMSDAKKYIERFFEQYPGVQSWMDDVIVQTKELGYVTTVWGRRRYVPGIYEKNKNLYDAAKRIAINTVAQGTAAELVKKGMLNLQLELQEYEASVLLQIHDELLISVDKKDTEVVQQKTKEALEQVVDWNVPLAVTIRLGNNWQDVTK